VWFNINVNVKATSIERITIHFSHDSVSAQCFPRHACPLYGSVLMHLHDLQKSPPGLAGPSVNDPQTIMQIHAPYARMTANLITKGKIP